MDNCFFAYQKSPYSFHCYFNPRLLEIIDFKIFLLSDITFLLSSWPYG